MAGMAGVAIGGLGLLLAVAMLIGLWIDRDARHEAWSRIAAARRTNAENRRDLEQEALRLEVHEQELDIRERRLDLRETRFLEREVLLEEFEGRLDAHR
jgi:hypothetical protein